MKLKLVRGRVAAAKQARSRLTFHQTTQPSTRTFPHLWTPRDGIFRGVRKLTTVLSIPVIAAALASGCSATKNDAGNATAPTAPRTAQTAAEAIKAAIPEITALLPITEGNDANNMIGRSTGYVAATVLVDPRTGESCDQAKPSIACGAGVEQWPDAAAAKVRADYIEKIKSAAPILGTEYAILRNNLLLRIDGKLKPSVAEAYEAAFLG